MPGAHFRDKVEAMERITIIPGLCGGKPTIRGMRIRVADVLEMLASGMSHADGLQAFPYLEEDDIRAALAWAAKGLEHPVVTA
jgi:uncharacterized protein (DUF433 family)